MIFMAKYCQCQEIIYTVLAGQQSPVATACMVPTSHMQHHMHGVQTRIFAPSLNSCTDCMQVSHFHNLSVIHA